MRIAFVTDAAYPWNVGGLEALEYNEAHELSKYYDVHFFSFRWPNMKPTFKKNGITYHTCHSITKEKFYRHGRRSIREAVIYSVEILRIFKYRFDFVQVNEFPILHIPLLKLYCIFRRSKMVLDVAEVWDKDYWITYLGKFLGYLAYAYANWALKMGDAYIVNSSTTKELLIKKGVPSRKVSIFSPVLNNRLLSRIQAGRDAKRIIYAGRLIKEKGLDEWLRIVAELNKSKKDFEALIIGEGPEKNNLEKLISENGLESKVRIRNFYPESKKDLLYKAIKESKLLLQMSRREGLSIIVLESLALGTPVVLPRYSPIPKEVKDMCVVESRKALPGKIAEILDSKEKGVYIRSKQNLELFSISGIKNFYDSLFSRLRKGG